MSSQQQGNSSQYKVPMCGGVEERVQEGFLDKVVLGPVLGREN